MRKRFVSVWFPCLLTDALSIRQPSLYNVPFVLTQPSHGRLVITAANKHALAKGINIGMVLADARAIVSSLHVESEQEGMVVKILRHLAEWCIRFTPTVAMDPPDGLLLDVTGCSHLWGGDENYVNDMSNKLRKKGFDVAVAIADTIGTAWSVARFDKQQKIVPPGKSSDAIRTLPPSSLRLEQETLLRLHKLGIRNVGELLAMPKTSLRRRFGEHILFRMAQALGQVDEYIDPVVPCTTMQERLPCLEPIVNATGIEIALHRLLEQLCERLKREQQGIRVATLSCYREDGYIQQARIGTHKPSTHKDHLFKLFELKINELEPGNGFELFVLEATRTEDHLAEQEKLWEHVKGLQNPDLSELLDRISGKLGIQSIQRFLPAEHYWPERSIRPASSIEEKSTIPWRTDRPRPVHLLQIPQQVQVAAPIPDYPPMVFRYKGKLHTIKKADGPERIEQEWWLEQGEHRDYYCVEDEEGQRFWLFRSGHYNNEDHSRQWFIHGFFS